MIFRIIFVVIWFAFFLIRMPHMKIYKQSIKKKTVRPELERFLVFVNFIGMGLLPLTFVIIPTPGSLIIPLPVWVVVGCSICLALSLVLFHFVHLALGKNWSPILEIQEEHNLVNSGIYKYIRHPMYTQIWIWVIFQGLVLQNWLVELYGIIAWSILYFIRVPKEERMLRDEFGQQYDDYMKKTGRIVPKLLISAPGSKGA